MQKLIIVRGVPGTGKSTFAKKMFPDFENFENDMYHMENGVYVYRPERQMDAVKWCQRKTSEALRAGKSVVVSNTFTQNRFIYPYRLMATRLGCGFEVYSMHGDYKNIHNVPEAVLQYMNRGFEKYYGETDVYIENGEYVFKKS